jgi:RNA 2',3'-cyclic 3'-phosphodiesterase
MRCVSAPVQCVFEFCADLLAEPKRPKRPERLFFALFPSREAAAVVARFRDRFAGEHRLEGTPLRTERLHASVHHVGDYTRLRDKLIYAAKRAGKAVSMPPFEVTFGSIKSFEGRPTSDGRPPRRPVVLLGEGNALFDLHEILGAAMRDNGLSAATHFVPHMTLFYGSTPVRLQAIDPIRVRIDELFLIHSELWLTRYNVIDRWSLEN